MGLLSRDTDGHRRLTGMASLPKLLILAGVFAIVLGLLWAYQPGLLRTLFGWFGRLPGDIRYQNGNTFVFVPWVSMLVLSVVLSLLARLFR
ncbi:DUF2905 domain-containing protein [Deinococcus radiodurans R1 = ATCC 13939 = DSM 20539]|uniref:DUF2905 domain-containing protein n=2 Tax=Deinococcus radiodurans TaxID=1299 RepID=Q9RSN8_DEIRA|nr:hypothetical protein DR_2086 [Deinococcus radiodurans R1 = ATCC 13939 = DSM 20539]QEM71475.1 DUF2905 domain-containing protein [Deinococcus radiodurans]UDL01122.1 DUF2905 domain-containing protein [Deinococcus radiodurans R1 = ATCC 13939 = DSM 20539]HCE63892.1 DUF2905 domain-containing protein [Deinococcus radiodurans]